MNEIEHLELPAITRNALVRAGFRTCEELRLATDQQLLREPQIGAKGIVSIRRALSYRPARGRVFSAVDARSVHPLLSR